MIIGHFVFSTESGEISMSNALVVDQAHVLKRKDLKMVGKINQRKLQEQVSHPMARHREMNCYL